MLIGLFWTLQFQPHPQRYWPFPFTRVWHIITGQAGWPDPWVASVVSLARLFLFYSDSEAISDSSLRFKSSPQGGPRTNRNTLRPHLKSVQDLRVPGSHLTQTGGQKICPRQPEGKLVWCWALSSVSGCVQGGHRKSPPILSNGYLK